MQTLDSEEYPLTVGDDYNVERRMALDEEDSIEEAGLTVKVSEFDSDDDAVIQKRLTSETGITEDSLGQTVLFQLSSAEDTQNLDPYTEYVYDIQLKMESGRILTYERGTFVPRGQVTTTVWE
jgi:hypothetical protein